MVSTTAGSIHGSAVIVQHAGILVRGPSGSGKSALCHGLIQTAHLAGDYCAWIADDRLLLSDNGHRLIARPVPEVAGLAEHRHLGVVPVNHVEAAVIDIIVDLSEVQNLERPGEFSFQTTPIEVRAPQRCMAISVPMVLELIERLRSGHV